MKARTALISVTLTGALIAGGVYAAYHTVGKAAPVEVTSVANVAEDMSYFTDETTIEGTVTSKVSQNITLDSEYDVAEIYVSEGDSVTEGTALFSYDMTGPEIELEGLQIELQKLELELKGYNKQLAKYTGTSTTASLEDTSSVKTASAMEIDEILPDDTYETEGSTESSIETPDSESSGLEIEDIETVETPESDTDTAIQSAVTSYEALMSGLAAFLDEFEGDVMSDDIEDALLAAVEFYRGTLADETITETDGETIVTYTLKDTVTAALGEDGIKTLESCASLMEHISAYYVDLLITEAAAQSDPASAVQKARDAYEDLSSTAKDYVTQLETLKALEAGLAASETEPVTESEVSTESETEPLTEAITESETELSTEPQTELPAESETELQTDSESQTEPVTEGATELQTETDSSVSDLPVEETGIAVNVNSFLLMTDELISETATPAETDYQNAIAFYQMYLAVPQAEIVGEDTYMENYVLSDKTLAYLADFNDDGTTRPSLEDAYRSVCLDYVKYAANSLIPGEMTWDDLSYAVNVYGTLGTTWAAILSEESPSVFDMLTAYSVALGIQDLDETSETFLTDLESLYEQYLMLSEEQMLLVWNADTLLELVNAWGLMESESETESEFGWDDWDDWGGYDYGYDSSDTVTQEEIDDLKDAIKEKELEIKQKELDVAKAQRIVDGKTVTSSVTGTVVSVDDADGDYFMKITNTEGLYVKSYISEQQLESVAVGDIVEASSWLTGTSFTAVIKEISGYPENGYYSYSGDSSLAYYPFYALIDDPDGIETGDYVELTIISQDADTDSSIWLMNYFVLKDSTGSYSVYVQGSDDKLEQRSVTVGKTYYSTYIEITSGLDMDDLIAFPYGNNVAAGADTTEVDTLTAIDTAW